MAVIIANKLPDRFETKYSRKDIVNFLKDFGIRPLHYDGAGPIYSEKTFEFIENLLAVYDGSQSAGFLERLMYVSKRDNHIYYLYRNKDQTNKDTKTMVLTVEMFQYEHLSFETPYPHTPEEQQAVNDKIIELILKDHEVLFKNNIIVPLSEEASSDIYPYRASMGKEYTLRLALNGLNVKYESTLKLDMFDDPLKH